MCHANNSQIAMTFQKLNQRIRGAMHGTAVFVCALKTMAHKKYGVFSSYCFRFEMKCKKATVPLRMPSQAKPNTLAHIQNAVVDFLNGIFMWPPEFWYDDFSTFPLLKCSCCCAVIVVFSHFRLLLLTFRISVFTFSTCTLYFSTMFAFSFNRASSLTAYEKRSKNKMDEKHLASNFKVFFLYSKKA